MVNKLETAPVKKSGKQDSCCHYWVVESPNGATSRGTCKFCGAEREFENYGLDY
jgi:hypothetical protein